MIKATKSMKQVEAASKVIRAVELARSLQMYGSTYLEILVVRHGWSTVDIETKIDGVLTDRFNNLLIDGADDLQIPATL